MFPEHRLLLEELNAFSRNAEKVTCVSIVAKVVWIGQMIVTHFAGFPSLDTQCAGQCVQPVEYCVGRSEVADGCHHSIPEKLFDSPYVSGVLYAPVR